MLVVSWLLRETPIENDALVDVATVLSCIFFTIGSYIKGEEFIFFELILLFVAIIVQLIKNG